jgi:hypothetical protein
MERLFEQGIDANEEDKAFAVGVMRGTWCGVVIALVLVVSGAVVPAVWRFAFGYDKPATTAIETRPQPAGPFETATVYNNVPFIRLSEAAVRYGLNKSSTRKLIEREMISRWYFEQEGLKGRTRYIPKLRDPANVHSVITLANGTMKEVVVQLISDDGSPGRYGLIPLDEYEDDIRGFGR